MKIRLEEDDIITLTEKNEEVRPDVYATSYSFGLNNNTYFSGARLNNLGSRFFVRALFPEKLNDDEADKITWKIAGHCNFDKKDFGEEYEQSAEIRVIENGKAFEINGKKVSLEDLLEENKIERENN